MLEAMLAGDEDPVPAPAPAPTPPPVPAPLPAPAPPPASSAPAPTEKPIEEESAMNMSTASMSSAQAVEDSEKARIAEIDAEMLHDDLKDRTKQSLIAERLRLIKNEEARQQDRKFRDLLNNETMTAVVKALQDAATVDEYEKQKADVQLLFGREEGRRELATVLGTMDGVQVFPEAGFTKLSEMIGLALNQMAGTATPLFDDFLVCSHPPLPSARPGTIASITEHSRFPRGVVDKKGRPRERPDGCENFCFPVHPSVAAPPPFYTVVRTLDSGERQYGFCKSMPQEGTDKIDVLCLLSRHPWFEMFETVLGSIGDKFIEHGYAGVERTLDDLFNYSSGAFPMPGERFKVTFRGGECLYLTRPDDESVPLVDTDCSEMFLALGVAGVLAVFKSMLAEGHCVFVSNDFRKLGTCAQAAASLLYPFTWQQIFVPILPLSWIDYITAPMPFVCGVHDSMFEKVLEQPIEDAMVFAQLDTGDIMRAGSEQGHMPKNATEKLEKTWTKLLADLKKQKVEPKKFSHLIREAAVDFMISVVGNYRSFVTDVGNGDFEFDFVSMVEAVEDDSDATFIRALEGAQMFDIWRIERVALAKEGYPRKGLFESKVADRLPPGAAGTTKARQDVSTARILVSSSRNIRKDNAMQGQTLLESIRSHEIWKKISLWDDIFADDTDDSLPLDGQILGVAENMMEFGIPLDLVMKFTDKAADRHSLEAVTYGSLKDGHHHQRYVSSICPSAGDNKRRLA